MNIHRLPAALRRCFRQPTPLPSSPPQMGPTSEPEAILYRILGSDRPPLIPIGTTYDQLRFLLDYEPNHPGLVKRWLLNRLPDPAHRQALVELLDKHHQVWSEIPFEASAYVHCWTDIGALPDPLHPWGHDFPHRPAVERVEVLDYVARSKNLYLLHRNGARNWALETGLRDAPWVFPWDGACFLTSEAWQVIRPLLQVPQLAYLAVPTAGLDRQDALLQGPDQPPHARLAPQLGFSRVAREHYPPQWREGPWSDHALFRRLSLPGPWLEPEAPLGLCPWETVAFTPVPDGARLVQAGWTYRLAGTRSPEVDQASDAPTRIKVLDSIRLLTRRTDMALIGTALGEGTLRCWTALAGTPPVLPDLATIAANARAIPPPSVTDKPQPIPGTADRSYVNAVPHWQSLAGSESALDRSALLGTTSLVPGDVARTVDRARLQLMVDCVCSLALDAHLNANQASREHAHRLLHTWFIHPATAMIPDGAHARLSAGASSRNVLAAAIDFRDVYPLLDAITLLRQAGSFSMAEQQQLDEWLDAFLHWLSNDSAAFLRDHCASTAATWYHLVVLAIAAYRGKRNVAAQVFDNLPGLLAKQFRADGSPRGCGTDARLGHDQLFNLQAWTNLVVISSALGRDLLAFTDSNGLSVHRILLQAKCQISKDAATVETTWSARQWLEAMEGCLQPETLIRADRPVPLLAEVSTGLPPFWTLCRSLRPRGQPESAPSPLPHWPGC
jgi:hypothetical protein